MKRDKLNIFFRVIISLCVLGLVFIAIYNSFSSMEHFAIVFWAIVIFAILMKVLQAVLLERMDMEFVEIEAIDTNEENIVGKLVNQFKLGNKEDLVTGEKFSVSTYANKLTSKGLVYAKADVINDSRMLVIKNYLDEYSKKHVGYQIYLLLDIVTYTREVEIMLKQFTVFTDKYKLFDVGFADVDTNILVLSMSSRDKKFRIGGTTYKYNINDFKKMKKQIKRIVSK